MSKAKENRKVQYTKRVLRESLEELLQSKDISKITISELTKRADINRSTFYAHYETIDDLFREIEEQNAEKIFRSLHLERYDSGDFQKAAPAQFIELMNTDCDLLFWLFDSHVTGRGIQVIHDRSREIFLPLWKRNHRDLETQEYIFEFLFNGCFAILRRRYQNPDELSDQQLKNLFQELVSSVVAIVH